MFGIKSKKQQETQSITHSSEPMTTQNGELEAEAGKKSPNPLEQSHTSPQVGYSEELSTSSQQTIEEPDYFDEFIEQGETAQAEQEQAQIQSSLMSEADFIKSFIGLHEMGAAFSGIKAIAIPNSKISDATGEEIAKMFYRRILSIPMLHFLLDPRATIWGDLMLLAFYLQGMRGAIAEEMAAKRKDSDKKPKSTTKTHDSGELSPDQAAALGAG